MKKKFIIFIFLLTMMFPVFANAESTDANGYKTTNLEEALTQEDIKHDLSKYKETDDQVTIYLFRGHGCGYCQSFLTFLNSIVDDYGKYFKLVSYEVWNDKNNSKLLEQVADFTGEDAGGVPYIIIGEKVFPGYVSDWDDDIKEAIKTEYEKDEKYDVMQEMEKASKDENKTTTTSSSSIYWNLGFITIATLIIIIFISTYNKKLNNRIDAIYDKLEIDVNEVSEEKKDKKSTDDDEQAEEALAEKNIAKAEKLLKEEKDQKKDKIKKDKK